MVSIILESWFSDSLLDGGSRAMRLPVRSVAGEGYLGIRYIRSMLTEATAYWYTRLSTR